MPASFPSVSNYEHSPCGFTVLQTLGHINAAKKFTRKNGSWDKRDYDEAANFMFTEYEFADLAELGEALDEIRGEHPGVHRPGGAHRGRSRRSGRQPSTPRPALEEGQGQRPGDAGRGGAPVGHHRHRQVAAVPAR